MAEAAKAALEVETLDVIADRGYFASEQIKQCADAGVNVTLPKPQTASATPEGRFSRVDFIYLPDQDVYRCPANQVLPHHCTTFEKGFALRRYWTSVCSDCNLKSRCTPGKERRVTRWEHERLLEDVQRRLDANPQAMRVRRETVDIRSARSRREWVQLTS